MLTLEAGNHDEGSKRVSVALSINPNSAFANYVKGGELVLAGHPSEGRAYILAALQLDPRSPHSMSFLTAHTSCYEGEHDYLSAVETGKRAVARYPDDPRAYRWLAAALGQLGRDEKLARRCTKRSSVSSTA